MREHVSGKWTTLDGGGSGWSVQCFSLGSRVNHFGPGDVAVLSTVVRSIANHLSNPLVKCLTRAIPVGAMTT